MIYTSGQHLLTYPGMRQPLYNILIKKTWGARLLMRPVILWPLMVHYVLSFEQDGAYSSLLEVKLGSYDAVKDECSTIHHKFYLPLIAYLSVCNVDLTAPLTETGVIRLIEVFVSATDKDGVWCTDPAQFCEVLEPNLVLKMATLK